MNESSLGRDVAIRFESARKAGRLSGEAMEALGRVPDFRTLALGTPVEKFVGREGILVTVMPDDSGSLNAFVTPKKTPSSFYSRINLEGERRGLVRLNYDVVLTEATDPRANGEAVRIGHNTVVEALETSPRPESVLFATRLLKGVVVNNYRPLNQVVRLDRLNFLPTGGTPLFDGTVETLKMVLAKYEEFRSDFKKVRTATLLVTDGLDENSITQNPASVAAVITSMRATGHHIVAAMGILNGETDFREVFIRMGIDPNWILTTGSTKEEIQRAFGMFAEAASKTTNIEDFPKLLTAGFGVTKT